MVMGGVGCTGAAQCRQTGLLQTPLFLCLFYPAFVFFLFFFLYFALLPPFASSFLVTFTNSPISSHTSCTLSFHSFSFSLFFHFFPPLFASPFLLTCINYLFLPLPYSSFPLVLFLSSACVLHVSYNLTRFLFGLMCSRLPPAGFVFVLIALLPFLMVFVLPFPPLLFSISLFGLVVFFLAFFLVSFHPCFFLLSFSLV